jgi:4-hydroxyacetophenone monooxygenase
MTNKDNDRPWPQIEADDETIRAAIAEACVPALMNVMVQISGDNSVIRTDIKPQPNVLADPQAGITDEQQAQIRAQAFEMIRNFRDAGSELPAVPDASTIQEMINFITGEELDKEYVALLRSELSLDGESTFEQPAMQQINPAALQDFSVLVIGAGMSGIATAVKLKEAGISYTVIEKNAEVGGTWFENTYPGCRVDSPNHTYSYSFAPTDWPQYYSSQPVLLEYFKSVATDFGIRDSIRFDTEVKQALFNEASGLWEVVVLADGEEQTLVANAVISAVGQLNRPRIPDIKGAEDFNGPSFHSGCWEHEHDLRDKNVAVIGTGASAFQFVPLVAREARQVNVFQRTPPWVSPREEYHDEIPAGKHWLLNNLPYYANWYRFFMFWRTSEGMLPAAKRDPAWNEPGSISARNQMIRDMLTENARSIVGDDADLFARVIPDYPPAGKRMLVDNGTWYNALKRPNVSVVTDPISSIDGNAIQTEDGASFDADVLIYGTGFQASNFLAPMRIVGRDGVELHDHWQGDPRAYMGMTVPGFPNLFVIYGPNTNLVVNGSIIFFSECQVRYIMGCLATLMSGKHKTMEPKQQVHDRYNERIDAGNLEMSWGSANVSSWYKNADGRVTQNWPFTLREFWEQTRAPDLEDYELG